MRRISITLGFLMVWMLIGCRGMSRIIRKTNTTAIIEGRSITRIEAKLIAEEKAKGLFGTFKETEKAECSKETKSELSSDLKGRISGETYTYWSCIIYVEKK